MIYQTALEEKLVAIGFDNFTLVEKNKLVAILADKAGVGYTDITEDFILQHHKDLKIELLSEDCENAIVGGFVSSNGHTYRTNRDDQLNMIGQKDELISDTSIETVMWKTEDAGYTSHTRDEWLSIYSEAFNHKKTQLFKYNTLKGNIQIATSHPAILDIAWQ